MWHGHILTELPDRIMIKKDKRDAFGATEEKFLKVRNNI